jgi:lipoate-protein ligase A
LEDDGVVLARRQTGGGCVYHDLGNSVFSFINPIEAFESVDYKTLNNDVLIAALEAGFQIKAEASGRNDLVIKREGDQDRKISGSAYKLKLGQANGEGRRSLHHGTMLLDIELGALGNYLSPNKAKLESKAVESVVSRV